MRDNRRMPTWAKVLLTIILIIVALFVAGGFLTYRWVMSNKDRIEAAHKEGLAFGAGKDGAQCVDAALDRMGRDMSSQIATRMFVAACLSTAKRSDALCEGVPPRSEIMKRAQWGAEQCHKRGIANQQGCLQIYQAVAEACY